MNKKHDVMSNPVYKSAIMSEYASQQVSLNKAKPKSNKR